MASLPLTSSPSTSTSALAPDVAPFPHVFASDEPVLASLFSSSVPENLDKTSLWVMSRERERQLLEKIRSAEESLTEAYDEVAYWQNAFLHRSCTCGTFQTEISDLPDEILAMIFHKLNTFEHQSLHKVSLRWKSILALPFFTQHLVINADTYLGYATPFLGARKMREDCASLVGDDIRHITFYSNNRFDNFVSDILGASLGLINRCPKLEHLTFCRLRVIAGWSSWLPETLKMVTIVNCTVELALSLGDDDDNKDLIAIPKLTVDMTGDRDENIRRALAPYFPQTAFGNFHV